MYIPMIDTLEFGVMVEMHAESKTALRTMLAEKKEEASRYRANNTSDKATIEIGYKTFEVMPNGKPFYAFLLHNTEYEIDTIQHDSKNPAHYPFKVKIKSEALWSMGPDIAYNNIIEWLENNFGHVETTKISRADLCCHTDAFSISHNEVKHFKGLFRKKSIEENNRNITGINFGRRGSLIYCRIYDKKLEVDTKLTKKWFYKVWADAGSDCLNAWNIEFELRRTLFVCYGLETVEDFFDHLKSIWIRCTHKWLVKTLFDRTRIENSTIDPVWEQISHVFDEFESLPLIKKEDQEEAGAKALIPQYAGLFTTIAAKRGLDESENASKELFEDIKKYYESKKGLSIEDVIAEKMALNCHRKGGDIDGKIDIYDQGSG